jgi:ABC-2 type transport system ATP-binding protein
MIQVRGISKSFGSTRALSGVSLEVPEGASMALLGRNGAGKTTLAKIVLGLVRADSGTAAMAGASVSSPASRLGARYLPENVVFPRWATPMQLFRQLERVRRSSKPRDLRERASQLACEHLLDRPMGKMSRGQKQRAALALATCGKPDVLILDEPSSGLDPEGRVHLRGLIRRLSSRGTTLLLNSHLLGEVESVCQHAAFIREGEMVGGGPLAELSRSKGEVEIEAEDPAGMAEALAGRGLTASAGEDGGVLVRMDEGAGDVREVASAAVATGLPFSSLRLRRETLEDIFLRMMKGDD